MSTPKIPIDFARYSDSGLFEFGSFIHQEVSTRTSLFPETTPTMVVLKDALDDFLSASNAAQGGGRVLIGQRKVARKNVEKLLTQLSYCILMLANGDFQIVLQSGFPLTKPATPRVLPVPGSPKADHGNQPGELQVSVPKVTGAVAYLHQVTDDPEMKDESWQTMSCSSSKCLIDGLTPGKLYYIRVGAIGTKDQVLYSNVISKMVA